MVKKPLLVLACSFVIFVSAPAVADWLVLRGGARVETEGPWRIEGRSVIFERPGGPLSSLPVSEVDLEASHEATAEAEVRGEEEEEPDAEAKEPVLILRDGDLPTYLVPPAAGEGGEDEEAREPSPVQNGLRVVQWRAETVEDGLEITGRIENTTSSRRSGIGLVISIRESEEGPPEASVTARVDRRILGPGESTPFRARLRDLWEIDGEVDFDLESSSLVFRGVPPQSDDGS